MSETIINQRQIHWFPGHMAKTLRLMEQEIRHIDCVLQILDARIPLSSLNPEIERITAGKPHLYVLNKADLADPEITQQWLAYFRSAGAGCLPMDSRQKGRANAIKGPIEKELAALTERRRARGLFEQFRAAVQPVRAHRDEYDLHRRAQHDDGREARQHEAERAHPGGRPQKDEQQHARREQTDGDGEQPEQGEEGVGGEGVFCAAARVPRQL